MLSFLVLIFVSLLPFVSTWLTSPQDIFLEKDEVFHKPKEIFKRKTSWRLTNKGKMFLGIAILTIFFAWVQYYQNQQATSELQSELSLRDSINRAELRTRDIQSRQEQYRRDSINNEKLRVRDSVSYSQLTQRDSINSKRIEKGKTRQFLF